MNARVNVFRKVDYVIKELRAAGGLSHRCVT